MLENDNNKTHLTKIVTASAMVWLFERGFKPLAAEVRIRDGWVADAAGVSRLTPTEVVKLKLLPHWGKLWERRQDWNAAYRALPSPLACLLEVKTTREDYAKDHMRKFGDNAPPLHLGFIAVPPGLLKPVEYPDRWGILECTSSAVKMVAAPKLNDSTLPVSLTEFVYELALKCDHDTRYVKLRKAHNESREYFRDRRVHGRMADLVDMLTRELTGDAQSVLHERLPENLKKALAFSASLIRTKFNIPAPLAHVPRVVNVRSAVRGTYVYIAREIMTPKWQFEASPFANPFCTGTREEMVQRFRDYADRNPALKRRAQDELHGKNLGCWCVPLLCHGEYLLEIANPGLNKGTTRADLPA